MCGRSRNLQVHHTFYAEYEDYGEDRGTDHLATLCRDCHVEVHGFPGLLRQAAASARYETHLGGKVLKTAVPDKNGAKGHTSSTLFLCDKYIRIAKADGAKMKDAMWLSLEELASQKLFPVFEAGIEKLVDTLNPPKEGNIIKNKVNNDYSDAQPRDEGGRFTGGNPGSEKSKNPPQKKSISPSIQYSPSPQRSHKGIQINSKKYAKLCSMMANKYHFGICLNSFPPVSRKEKKTSWKF